MNRIRA